MQDVNRTKERILSIIKEKGPCLPVQIARLINVSPLFTSVFLSELYEDSKLRMSHMKIGSSSLYILEGQEAQLENFIEHLNPREKEAFFLIKKEKVLEDEKQTPVIRVALRAIKDFAIPFKLTINSMEKTFWKYYLVSEEDTNYHLHRISNPNLLLPLEPKNEVPIKEEVKENEKEEMKTEQISQVSEIKITSKNIKKKKPESSEFLEQLKDYLLSKEVEILESILEKKKEFLAKVRIDSLFGKQEFYLIAKDKKKITETDLALALQKAQAEKMPALVVSTGEIDKKACQYAKDWRNLIKFDKINL